MSCKDCTYEAPSSLDFFHNIQRHSVSGGGQPGDDFAAVNGDDQLTYGEGIAFPAAIIAVVGLLLVGVISIWTICSCYCSKCLCCHARKKYPEFEEDPEIGKSQDTREPVCVKRHGFLCLPTGSHYDRNALLTILCIAIPYCVLAILNLKLTGNLSTNLRDTMNSVKDVNTLTKKVHGSIGESRLLIEALNGSVSVTSTELVNLAETEFVKNETSESVSLRKNALHTLREDFVEAGKKSALELRNATSSTTDILDPTNIAIDNGDGAIDTIGEFSYGYAAALIAIFLLLVISLFPRGICKPVFKASGTLNLLWLFVTWLVAAIMLAILVAASDFCQEPFQTAQRMTSNTKLKATIEYYSQCPGDDNFNLMGLPSELRSALNFTADMEESVSEVRRSFIDSKNVIESKLNDSTITDDYSAAQIQRVEDLLSSLTANLFQMSEETDRIHSLLSPLIHSTKCDQYAEPTFHALNTLCHDAMGVNMSTMWKLQLVLMVFAGIVSVAAVFFCIDHPGKVSHIRVDHI